MEDKDHLLENHKIIQQFVDYGFKRNDTISNFIKATMAQFLLNVRSDLHSWQQEGHIDTIQLIDAQINQLSKCIVHLKESRDYLTYRNSLQ